MKYKFIWGGALAFNENKDLKKLSRLAKEGWALDSASTLFYRLKKEQPQNLTYIADYKADYSERYFRHFADAGWTFVTSLGDEIHIFCGAENTTPIYSDPFRQVRLYKPKIKKTAIISAISFPLMIIFATLIPTLSLQGRQFAFALVLSALTFTVFAFNFIPLLGYLYRVSWLKKRSKNL